MTDTANPKHTLARMLRLAERYAADADLLASSLESRSSGGYLLRLLAFEILLKAALLAHGKRRFGNHNYAELFCELPAQVQQRLRHSAEERVSTAADYSALPSLLNAFQKNFTKLRYSYEAYEDLDEDEYQQVASDWIAEGAPLNKATFVYHPHELDGLLFALRAEVTTVCALAG